MENKTPVLVKYHLNYMEPKGENELKAAERKAINFKDTYDAVMEAFALVLDVVGEIEYTYTTKTSNTVHVVMDSP